MVACCIIVVLFAAFNLVRERGVTRVVQTDVPSAQAVNQVVRESRAAPAQPADKAVLRTGIFINGAKAYKGSGSARVVTVDGKPVISFGDDFSTSSGPDLQVYLSMNADVKSQGLGEFVTLGGLKSTTGAQVYNLPENHADYASVVVWCRAFTSVFAQTELR